MPKIIDITGQEFDKLVAIRPCRNSSGKRVWLCECECGRTTYVPAGQLRNKNTRSCGCISRGKPGSKHWNWKGGAKNFGTLAHAKRLLRSSKKNAEAKGHAPLRITPQELVGRMLENGDKCQVCPSRGVVPDHDHTTGLLRGFLCPCCNTAIGLMKDSPDLLRRAARYLK